VAYTESTTLGELLKDPKAVEVLDKHIPGMSKHPMLSMATGFSLKMIAGFPQAGMSPDKLKLIVDDLAKL